MKNILHLYVIQKNQKANSIISSGVEEKDSEKTTKVTLEILKLVDQEFKKMIFCLFIY